MTNFNFQQCLEEAREMDANWYLLIQVLESRVMENVMEKKEDWFHFKSKIQELTWEEREINITTLAQVQSYQNEQKSFNK